MSEARTGNAEEMAYVAVGSNLGDREAVFAGVIRALEAAPKIALIAASPVFETDPVGPGNQGPYLNAAICLEAGLSASELLEVLQSIELDLGRDRSDAAVRWGPRLVDLDILFFGDREIDTPRLAIPHPRAHERAFVMAPMALLAPQLRHPVLGKTIRSLADSLPDLDSVRPWPTPPGWPAPPGE